MKFGDLFKKGKKDDVKKTDIGKRFDLHGRVGQGSMSKVWRATDYFTNNMVAVKVLDREKTLRFESRFPGLNKPPEGEIACSLDHPNCVRTLEHGTTTADEPFLVMEFVEGQTLRDLVRLRGKLPVDLSLRLTYEIAAGLAHAAAMGISHRDLKLSNVLISSDGKAKLVDFGLAALSDRKNPDQIADCPNARAIDYAALERGTGVRKDDPRSDVFFTGNMLYHMLAGTPALTETRDRLARLNVSRFQDIKPIQEYVPDIPGLVNQLLGKMMEFNPQNRIQSSAALQAEVKKIMDLLEKGPEKNQQDGPAAIGAQYDDDVAPTDEGEGYVVLLVESKVNLQNAIRERLKSRGYRVLIIQDPNRALARFGPGEDPPADCVIFSAAELGSLALEAFNQFATDEHTAEIPAVLLVDRRQTRIIAEARRGPRRILLALPLKVRELRAGLLKVLSGPARRPIGSY